MSDDTRDSNRTTKKRPSWRDMLGRGSRNSKTLEPSERTTRNMESGNERNNPPTTSGVRENERNRGQSSRPGTMGIGEQATSRISPGPADGDGSAAKDDDEEITSVIEVNLAKARRLVDELCKKEK